MIRRPLLTLLLALAAAAASIALCATRLQIDTSLASLFDQNDPSTRALVRSVRALQARGAVFIPCNVALRGAISNLAKDVGRPASEEEAEVKPAVMKITGA